VYLRSSRLAASQESRSLILLKASHIKPWRACDTGQERLEGFNGLMLDGSNLTFGARAYHGGFDLKWFLQTKSGGRWPPDCEP
jgi:hypothetical protein